MSSPEMQRQRDHALACLILALSVAAAVFVSVFGGREGLLFEEARQAVALHERLLRESAETLRQNQAELRTVRAALAETERTQHP